MMDPEVEMMHRECNRVIEKLWRNTWTRTLDVRSIVYFQWVMVQPNVSKLYFAALDHLKTEACRNNGIHIPRNTWHLLDRLDKLGFSDCVPRLEELRVILNLPHFTEQRRAHIISARACREPFMGVPG